MKYLIEVTPSGSIRMSLLQPPKRSPSKSLPYCFSNSSIDRNGFHNYNCTYWDENFVLHPTVEDHDVFCTTRVSVTNEELDCDLFDYGCQYKTVDASNLYIADIEKFTLLIDHTLYADFGSSVIQKNAFLLSGKLIDIDNKPVELKAPNQIGVVNKSDIIELGVIMKAAGFNSLDDISDVNSTLTYRNSGVVFLLYITYSNMKTYDLNNIEYTISARRVDLTKFKAIQSIFSKNISTGRVLWNRHGIRIIVLQTGKLGKFDFQTMLLTFVSGIGLIAVSSTIVDILATKILPGRKIYYKIKYQDTEKIKSKDNPKKKRIFRTFRQR